MPGIAVCNIDTAGGLILPGPNTKVFFHQQPLAVVGCPVAPHGGGSHLAAIMIQGSGKVSISSIPVVLAGDKSSCDHEATGQPTLTSNG